MDTLQRDLEAALLAHSTPVPTSATGGVGGSAEHLLSGHPGKCQLVRIRQSDVGNSMCGGSIGKLGKVCLKSNCDVEKHVEIKGVDFSTVTGDLYLIKSQCGTWAHGDPTLDSDLVNESDQEALEQDWMGTDEWVARFTLIRTQSASSNPDLKQSTMTSVIEDVTLDDVPTRKRRAQDLISKPINTPYTKRRTEVFGTPDELESLPFRAVDDRSNPIRAILSVNSHLQEFQNAVQGSHQSVKNRVSTTEKVLDGLSDSINVINALLGKYNDDPDLPPTLWGAVKVLQSKLDDIESSTSALKSAAMGGTYTSVPSDREESNKPDGPAVAALQARVNMVESKATRTSLDSADALNTADEGLKMAKSALALANSNQSAVSAIQSSIVPFTDPNGVLRKSIISSGVFVSQQLPALLQDIASLKQASLGGGPAPPPPGLYTNVGNLPSVAANGGSSGPVANDPVIVAINQKLQEAETHISSLRTDVVDVKQTLGGEHIQIGSISFESQAQTEAWLINNQAADFVMYFCDFIMFACIDNGGVGETEVDESDAQYKGTKVGHRDVIDRHSFHSLGMEVIPQLGLSVAASRKDRTHLCAVRAHEAFFGDGSFNDGVKQITLSSFLDTAKSIKSRIDDSSMSIVAKSVASALVDMSYNFGKAMFDFMTDQFTAYGASGGMGSSKRWESVQYLIRVVFRSLRRVRGPLALIAANEVRKPKVAGKILWTILNTHRVMMEFQALNFRLHTDLAPYLTARLYEIVVFRDEFIKFKEQVAADIKGINTTIGQIRNNKKKNKKRKKSTDGSNDQGGEDGDSE